MKLDEGAPQTQLTLEELGVLRRLVGFMVPSSVEYCMLGADDSKIFAEIVRSFASDQSAARKVLAMLRDLVGGDIGAINDIEAEVMTMALLKRHDPEITALGRAVLQCYYGDERVIRSLGLEAGPLFPKGRIVQQGDWSLLELVRNRPQMWRGACSTRR